MTDYSDQSLIPTNKLRILRRRKKDSPAPHETEDVLQEGFMPVHWRGEAIWLDVPIIIEQPEDTA